MLVSSASEDLLVSLFWNKWKVFLNHFSFENYWDSTRSKTAVPSTSKMIMIVWRPHITGSRDHLNLSLQWLVSGGGVVSYTFWSRYVISLEKSTKNHFFLFLYFSRMNWIHKFQMRVFEGGQCWHECQADWRINTVNLKEIQPPCPAHCLPSNSCSILFSLFNWAVVVQKRHKMMINLLSGEFKAQRVISWFPPSNFLFRLCLEVSHEDRSEWDLRANIVWPSLDHLVF